MNGLEPDSAGPFTYEYGQSIMDYPLSLTGNVFDPIYPELNYPAFHNWEYDLGVPQNPAPPWTPRTGDDDNGNNGDNNDRNNQGGNQGGNKYGNNNGNNKYGNNNGNNNNGNNNDNNKYGNNNGNNNGGTDSGTTTPPPSISAPSAPSGLGAVSQNASVKLSWSKPSNDGGAAVSAYQYQYKKSSASEWPTSWSNITLPDDSVLSFSVGSLTNGTAFDFQVRAGNGDNRWSVASGVASATPSTVPDAPASFTPVAIVGSVLLSWTPPDDNGGAAISGYKLQYASGVSPVDTDYSEWESVGDADARRKTISSLTSGTVYHFRLLAHNVKGDGAAISTSAVVPSPPPPPPRPVLSVEAGDGQVTLCWSPLTGVGSRLTGYEYRVDRGADGTWGSWKTLIKVVSSGTASSDTKLSVVITGLINGIEYAFQVRGKTVLAPGLTSNRATARPARPIARPGAVTAYKATIGDGSVRLTWERPTVTGGATISGYKYRFAQGISPAESAYSEWADTDSNSSHTVSNLTNGVAYRFQVRALNAAGGGTVLALVRTPAKPPGVISSLSSTRGDGWVELSWTAPTDSGTLSVMGYEYRYATVASPQETDFSSWASAGSGLSYRVTGLTNDIEHYFQVRAVSGAGGGVASSALAQTPVVPVPPGAPTLDSATPGHTQVALAWTAPTSSGTLPITHYQYQRVTGSFTSTTPWVSCGNVTSLTVTGLTNGTTYKFRVRAVSADGSGAASTIRTATPRTVPPPPTALFATSRNASVYLSWTAPSSNGGSAILGYHYRKKQSTSTSWGSWSSTGSNTYWTVSSLTNGTSYDFQVRARNIAGSSGASNPATATPEAVKKTPHRPTNVTATATNGQVVFSWDAPTNDHGGIDTYEYRIDENNDGSWSSWTTLNSSATSVTLPLTNGRDYGFQVRAKNTAGTSTQSIKVKASPVDSSVSTPSSPQSFTAKGLDRRVRLRWTAPSTGTGIIEYEYRFDTYNDGTWTVWKITGGTSTSYTVTGLTNNRIYAFQVRARNAGGAGTASSSQTATPHVPDPPGAPTNLTATLYNEYVYLSWTAPTDTGISAIKDYEVRSDSNSDGIYSNWVSTGDTSTDEYISDTVSGTTYAFQIRAVNTDGPGPASDAVTITIPTYTVPDAPASITAVGMDGQIVIGWGAPSSNGGTPITEYRYRHRVNTTGATWSSDTKHAVSLLRLALISSLTNETEYEVEVWAVNSVGEGPKISATATPTNKTVPGAPQYFDTFDDNGAVDLWWDAPSDNGNTPITDYEYRYRVSGGTWGSWTSTGLNAATDPDGNFEYTVTGLTNGTSYDFDVRAVNDVGAGASAGALTETPQPNTPDAPTNVTAATGSTTGTINLSWTAPADDGGQAITHYEYAYGKITNGRWQWVSYSSTGSTSTSYTVTGLESGVIYRFRVRAINGVSGRLKTSRVAQASAR